MALTVHFISLVFPPLKSPRSIQIGHLASYLKDRWQLRIYHAGSECRFPTDQSLNGFDLPKSVNALKASRLTRLLFMGRGDRLKKALLPDPFFPWSIDLFRKVRPGIRSGDLIVTFGQPMSMHITGILLKICFPGTHWLAHMSDPWTDNPYNRFNAWTRFTNRVLERLTATLASRIIFTSEITQNRWCVKYPKSRDRTLTLNHCYNEKLFPERGPTSTDGNPTLTLRYLGNFYGNRSAKPLVQAFETLCQTDPELASKITIEVIGQSQLEGDPGKLLFKGDVPYLESLRLMREADGLILIDAPSQESEFFPSKLVDYLGSGTPILGLTPQGKSRSVLTNYGFTCIDPAASPQEIALALRTFCRELQQKRQVTRSKSEYEVHQVGKAFENLLEAVTVQH